MNTTEKKYFDIFKKECDKWVSFFGIKNMHITIGTIKSEDGYFAASWPNYEAKACEIKLNLTFLDEENIPHIKRSAFHEVCEAMFSGIYHIAESRNYDEKIMNSEVHNIIRTLENTVFEGKK